MLTTHEVSDYSVTTYEVTPTTFRLHARSGRNQNEVKARSGRDQHEGKARSGRDQHEVKARSGRDQIEPRQDEIRTKAERGQDGQHDEWKSNSATKAATLKLFFPLYGCQHGRKHFYIFIFIYIPFRPSAFHFPGPWQPSSKSNDSDCRQ